MAYYQSGVNSSTAFKLVEISVNLTLMIDTCWLRLLSWHYSSIRNYKFVPSRGIWPTSWPTPSIFMSEQDIAIVISFFPDWVPEAAHDL